MNLIIFSRFIKLTASIFKDFVDILIINDNNNNNLFFHDYNLYNLQYCKRYTLNKNEKRKK